MSQLFEYTKHSDHYLIHHFSFEGNDDSSIGRFMGNYSMNKFMSPLEWRMIYDYLAGSIEKYLKNPKAKRPNDSIDVGDTNIGLNVEWSELNVELYAKIFPAIDLAMVYPFVMVIQVGCKSNMNKFIPPATAGSNKTTNNGTHVKEVISQKNASAPETIAPTPTPKNPDVSTPKTKAPMPQLPNASYPKAKKPTPKSPIQLSSATKIYTPTPKSPMQSSSAKNGSTSVTVEPMVETTLSRTIGSNVSNRLSNARELRIILDRLAPDHINQLTGTRGAQKRKHQSLNDSSISTPQKEMPTKRTAHHTPNKNTPFINSVNSTPYVRLTKIVPKPIEADVSHISAENDKSIKEKAGPKSSKAKKVIQNRLTKTPISSKKSGSKRAKPRLHVSIGHLTAKPKKSAKVKKSKKSKKSSKLITVSGDLSSNLEIVEINETDPFQRPSTSRASNDKENDRPATQSNGNDQTIDLKALTEDEVIAGFHRNSKLLTALFNQNVRQPDIERAADYTPFDMISLLTHQQFSNMLDLLYDQFKGFTEQECHTIFFEIIIPEWALAMFMRNNSMDRSAAIELINSQKAQGHEQSTMLSFKDE